MRKRSFIQVSSLIVFLSILTIIVQLSTYYFFESIYVILGVSCIISIICTNIFLEKTFNYETCFIYTLLMVFVSFVVTLLIYFGKDYSQIPYTNTLIGIIVINWTIPTLLCFLRSMFDRGPRFEGFNSFYRNNSIIFIVFYVVIFVYCLLFQGLFPFNNLFLAEKGNLIPFMRLATYIEDYIYQNVSMSTIVIYLASRILLFMPYGFYSALLLRKFGKLIRILSLLLFPILIEILQYFINIERCDIDDVIYAFIGGILGTILFYLICFTFRAVSGKVFLSRESEYMYSHSSLHF